MLRLIFICISVTQTNLQQMNPKTISPLKPSNSISTQIPQCESRYLTQFSRRRKLFLVSQVPHKQATQLMVRCHNSSLNILRGKASLNIYHRGCTCKLSSCSSCANISIWFPTFSTLSFRSELHTYSQQDFTGSVHQVGACEKKMQMQTFQQKQQLMSKFSWHKDP